MFTFLRIAINAAIFTVASLSSGAASANNYALLIGNSDYSIGALDNPANDANDLANVLRAIGFETIVRLNGDAETMKAAIRDFGAKLQANDGIGFFFFAGHGVQVNGENYLLPVGYPFRSEADIEKAAVPANLVLRYMEDSKNRVNVMVLDACRNNPFIKTRSLKTRGLAPMDAPSGSLVAFSTAPGTEASDGAGRNGLYTKHLMANIKVPGITVEQVFKRTREGVESESQREFGRKQSPREESSLKGSDMYFVAAPSAPSGTNLADIEVAYWSSISNSTNPADFESYLNLYPKGNFADIARNRLQAVKSGKLAQSTETRAAGEEGRSTVTTKSPMTAKSGGAAGTGSTFRFSDNEGENAIKAAEFLSISCRDLIRNKRVRVQMSNRSGGGALVQQSVEAKLRSAGVRLVSASGVADLVVKGTVEATRNVNPVLHINEIDMIADLSLVLPSGNTVATTSVSGGAYSGSNTRQAARTLWDEKAEEAVGRLLSIYCAGR